MERKYIESTGLWALVTDIGEIYAFGSYEEITEMWENSVAVDDEINDEDDYDEAEREAEWEFYHGHTPNQYDDDRY